jgi:hypothetical protein
MTVLEQLQTIKDKTIRQQAVHNILIQHNRTIINRIINKNKLYHVTDEDFNSFIWTRTEQGHNYWFNLYQEKLNVRYDRI